jgi:uncharacterized protein (DUF58 family)
VQGKFTSHAIALLLLTAFTIAVAAYYNNPLLVYTAVFLFTTNVVLFTWAHASVRGLRIRRVPPPVAVATQSAEIAIELTNTRHLARFGTLGFDLHSALTPGQDYSPVAFPVALGGSTVRSSYRVVPPRRGIYRLGPLFIYGGDPFGLYKCWHKVDQYSELAVLPCPVRFRAAHPSTLSELAREESGTLPRGGNSNEFLGVREYTPGEPLKRIHWLTSARLGRLFSRQYEMNVASAISLLLLGDESMSSGSPVDNPWEYSITMTASLGMATLVERFHCSYLALYGTRHDALAGSGRRFYDELSLRLTRLGQPAKLDWDASRSKILNLLAPESGLVVFTADLNETAIERINRLALHFRQLTVVSFNRQSFEHARPLDRRRSSIEGLSCPLFEVGYKDDFKRLLRAIFMQISISALHSGGPRRRQNVAGVQP